MEKHTDTGTEKNQKAKITLSNIKGFLQGNFRKFIDDNFLITLPDYLHEQIMWRLTMMDEACLKNKQCPCSCKVPNKQYEDRACENHCYPPMMGEKDWTEFKSLINLTKAEIEQKLYERKDLF